MVKSPAYLEHGDIATKPVQMYGWKDEAPARIGVSGESLRVIPDSSFKGYGVNALKIIDYAHHEAHSGSSFFYSDSVELASAATQDYMLTTADTTAWSHLTYMLSGSAITQVQIYEASDKTGTTLQTTRNHDRNSIKTAGMTIHKGTSGGTTDGTLIWQRKSGSSSAQSRTGDEASHNMEIILKQNTKYIFRITSGTNANLTNALFDWYEHTNTTA